MGKKAQLKKIRALAAKLPVQYQEGTIVLSGRQLIASGQKFDRKPRHAAVHEICDEYLT